MRKSSAFAPPSESVTHFRPVRTDCGRTVIEYDRAAGNGFCVTRRSVVEENTIAFWETSSRAAMVQGLFVAQGACAFLFPHVRE